MNPTKTRGSTRCSWKYHLLGQIRQFTADHPPITLQSLPIRQRAGKSSFRCKKKHE